MFGVMRFTAAFWSVFLFVTLPLPAQELSQGNETPLVVPLPASKMPTQTSKGLRFVKNGVMSRQVNVNAMGQNIVGDAANEPSIAVDPTNQSRMVIGWRQFGSVTSSFRQAGWSYSHDNGQTWTFPGSIEASVFRSDPVLAADADGNFYYNSLSSQAGVFQCTVFRSFDGGVTWDAGTFAQGGDKQWMCIDQSNSSMGKGNIYSNWNVAFSGCSGDLTVSYDGGNTYINCLNIPTNPRWGTIDVGTAGDVYFAGVFPTGTGLAKSITLQNSSAMPTFEFANMVDLNGQVRASTGPNPNGLLGQVYVAVDRSNKATRNNVYLLASIDTPGADPTDVMFARSEDGGETWSSPVRVNDDAPGANNWQWLAMMDVAPNGRIDVFWNDTRANPGSFISELYYAYSSDGGRTWSPNLAVSPSFDPHQGWPQQQKMGDYNDLVSGPEGVDVAYTATFGGEQNVFHLRINPNLCLADLNGDQTVDGLDLSLAFANWKTGSLVGDIDQNGDLNVIDLVGILNSQGSCF